MLKKYKVFTIITIIMVWVELVLVIGIPKSAQANITSMLGDEPNVPAPVYNPLAGPSYPVAQDSYFTDDSGNILMFVNILGRVARPGQFIVRENSDFSTILALSGGLAVDADIKKVLVIRHVPDINGKQAYVVNLKPFYKKGDRSGFIAFKPNDTIIIPEKGVSLSKISQYTSLISPFIYMYYLIDNNNN
jgi:hypothetical protein